MKTNTTILVLSLTLCLASCLQVYAQVPRTCYRVVDVTTPAGIAPEVSAVGFTREGDLVLCFRRGYIYIRDRNTLEYRRFASGLHTPLGIIAGDRDDFYVAQLPELTRVADTDGDGRADLFETICDDWGVSGNYHEFISGPLRDAQGNTYVSLGSTSFGNRALPQQPVRGTLTLRGRLSESPAQGQVNATGHYSPVSYRGWIVKIGPDGTLTPFACGFRQPNGIVLDADGELFAVDNQGDWVGTSPLHHVTFGAFHGHPSSLNWDESFGMDPVDAPIALLRRRRKMPAIQFPQDDMAGSTAQPLFDTTEGKFGPYAGQLFIAEWTHPRILRAKLEKVNGVYQGACFIFLEGEGLEVANNRMAFAPDGSLYVAQTSRGWGTREGLQQVVWTGKTCMDILDMKLTKEGFALTFTKPVNPETALDPAAYPFIHYFYQYHGEYGSDKMDVTPARVIKVRLSENRLTVRLTLEGLVPAGSTSYGPATSKRKMVSPW